MFLNDRSTRTLLGAITATLAVLIGVNLIINPDGLVNSTPWTLAALILFALVMFALNWREDYREAHPRLDADDEAAAMSSLADAPPLPVGVPVSVMYPEVTSTIPPSMPPAVPLVPNPPSPQPVPNPGTPPAPPAPPAPAPAEPPLPEPNEPVVPEPATPPVPDPSPLPTPQPTEPAVPPPAPEVPGEPIAPSLPDQEPPAAAPSMTQQAAEQDAPPANPQPSIESQDPEANPLEPTQITDAPASPGPSNVTPDPRTEEATPERIDRAENGSREDATAVGEAAIAPPQPDPRDAVEPPVGDAQPEARRETEPVNEPPADNAQAAPNDDSAVPDAVMVPIGDGTLPQGFQPLVETDLMPEDNTAPTEAPKTPDAVERQPVKASQVDDDLTRVEGIGKYYQKALNQIGYQTFAQLASANPQDILTELLAAGFRRHPTIDTWPEQAAYAARGDWDGLKAFQETLVSGRRK
jgi:predicted flap endonuclease-1-like 5' DNA nuclease